MSTNPNNPDVEVDDTTLTDRDKETLSVIAQIQSEKPNDAPTSSDVRERIAWMKQPSQSSYRFKKLTELGLANTEPKSTNTDRIPPNMVTLTRKGERVISENDLLQYANPETITQRLDKLESKNKSLQKQVAAQQAVIDEIERVFDDLGVNIDTEQIMRDAIN